MGRSLTHNLKIYGIEEPPNTKYKAAHFGIIHAIMSESAKYTNQKTHHVDNMVQLGFYFCLRSCYYTNYTRHLCTVKFCKITDFLFFVEN